jgi:uncharacterized protein
MYAEIPVLGVGIGLRRELAQDIKANRQLIDWCEVITEHYINTTPERLEQIRAFAKTMPVVPHGIDLSIGTDMSIEEEYLAGLETLVETVDAPWFTDHLCFTRTQDFNIGQLTPLRFSDEVVQIVVDKAKQVKRRIGRPFLLENITYYFTIPGGEMTEPEFITRVLEDADVGMLLDVCNLYINATNHDYDPYKFLRSIPLDRVVQLHLAGGFKHNNKWIDSHSYPVHQEVFELLEFIVAHAPVKGILLERDDNFPASFQELIDELSRAREIFLKHRGMATAKAS